MEKENIKRIILDNQEAIKSRKYIPRELKLPFQDLQKLQKVTAVIGPRRAGKTYFLKQISDQLSLQQAEIVFLDFSEIVLADFCPADFEVLYVAYLELFPDYTPVFLFDEIQEVKGYEAGLKYLLNRDLKIFITGSSSRMIVEELSTALRGKVVYYTLLPLSFSEFLIFNNYEKPLGNVLSTKDEVKITLMLKDYLYWGGFPEVALCSNTELKRNLIASYIDSMILRDIIERHSVKNIHLINLLFWKLVKAYTKEISINKWYNDFKSMGLKVSKDTLYLYLKYFEDTFFFHFISNYRKGVTGSQKVYLVDNGIYNHVKGFREDYGKNLENQVFIDLLREGENDISFIRTPDQETDFYTANRSVQVCYSLSDNNLKREIRGLKPAHDPGCKAELIIVDNNVSEDIPEVEYYRSWALN